MTKPSTNPEMNAAIVRLLRDTYPVSKASADYAAARIEELETQVARLTAILTEVGLGSIRVRGWASGKQGPGFRAFRDEVTGPAAQTVVAALEALWNQGTAGVLLKEITEKQQAAARIEELEAECVELLTDVFLAHSYRQPSGELQGWYDSQSNTDALLAGNRLVALGLWERRPGVYGKRQWYRRVEKNDEVRSQNAE